MADTSSGGDVGTLGLWKLLRCQGYTDEQTEALITKGRF